MLPMVFGLITGYIVATRYEVLVLGRKLREMMEAKQVAFSVVGDISKAHHRLKHREEEHGYLGCQIDASEEILGCLCQRGRDFGASCASYWWTRISAAGIRATHHLPGLEFMLDLLLYADDSAWAPLGGKAFRVSTSSGPRRVASNLGGRQALGPEGAG